MKNPVLLMIATLILLVLPGKQASADELIVNGDFSSALDEGFEGWVIGTGPSTYYAPIPVTETAGHYLYFATPNWTPETTPVIVPTSTPAPTPISAPYALIGDMNDGNPWLGSTDDDNDSWIYQEVTVPHDSLDAHLEFYYFCHPGSMIIGTVQEWQEIEIQNNAGVQLESVFLSNTKTPDGEWWVHSQDMNMYAGQTIRLFFNVHDDNGTDPMWMCVDDVSLQVNATASKTITLTQTITKTPSPSPTISPTITQTYTVTQTSTYTPTITRTVTLTPWHIAENDVKAYPNPANGNEVHFLYTVWESVESVSVEVYNLAGMKVATIKDGEQTPGVNRRTTWGISDVAPGIYLYRLTIEADNGYKSQTDFKKLVITK